MREKGLSLSEIRPLPLAARGAQSAFHFLLQSTTISLELERSIPHGPSRTKTNKDCINTFFLKNLHEDLPILQPQALALMSSTHRTTSLTQVRKLYTGYTLYKIFPTTLSTTPHDVDSRPLHGHYYTTSFSNSGKTRTLLPHVVLRATERLPIGQCCPC